MALLIELGEAFCIRSHHFLLAKKCLKLFKDQVRVIGEKASKGFSWASQKGLPGGRKGKKTSEKETICVTLDYQMHKEKV